LPVKTGISSRTTLERTERPFFILASLAPIFCHLSFPVRIVFYDADSGSDNGFPASNNWMDISEE